MNKLGEFIVLAIYLAMLFVLVRPGSQGPKLVSNSAAGVGNIIKAATGGGTWASA